jgi:hypothetical protein
VVGRLRIGQHHRLRARERAARVVTVPEDTPRRRRSDLEAGGPCRRREDRLEEAFDRYRRRAMVAFVFLTIVSMGAVLYAGVVGREGRRDLAFAAERVSANGCMQENRLRRSIRLFVIRTNPRLRARVEVAFPYRDCARETIPLQRLVEDP